LKVLTFAILAVLLCSCAAPSPPAASEAVPDADLLATYFPTPEPVVQEMLQAVDLKPGEVHFDLGSGDGRIVLAAAGDFGADSTGFEIDPDLVTVSRNRIRRAGLSGHARILSQDLQKADFQNADVITAFLTPEGLVQLEPVLRAEVRPDVRVVAYKFPVPGWQADEVITLEDRDPTVPTHEIFVYRGVPASGE
jgi:SAM-dependent methyltransferase